MPTAREKELGEELACATAELGKTSSELSGLRTGNKLLREKIDALLRRIFGAQSEKLDAAQLLLMLQGFDAPGNAPEPVEAEAPRRSTAPSPPRSDVSNRPDPWAARARDLSFFRDGRRRAGGVSVRRGLRGGLGAGRRPCLGSQARYVGLLAAGQPGEHVEEVFPHGHSVALAGFHDR